MIVAADTSFLFSLYVQDENSALAAGLLNRVESRICFTSLNRHELRNAFRLAVFRGHISPKTAAAALVALRDDLRHGVFERVSLRWRDVFRIADTFSAGHTMELGTRATDILHVAAAVTVGAERFLTFDRRQRALGAAVGLDVP